MRRCGARARARLRGRRQRAGGGDVAREPRLRRRCREGRELDQPGRGAEQRDQDARAPRGVERGGVEEVARVGAHARDGVARAALLARGGLEQREVLLRGLARAARGLQDEPQHVRVVGRGQRRGAGRERRRGRRGRARGWRAPPQRRAQARVVGGEPPRRRGARRQECQRQPGADGEVQELAPGGGQRVGDGVGEGPQLAGRLRGGQPRARQRRLGPRRARRAGGGQQRERGAQPLQHRAQQPQAAAQGAQFQVAQRQRGREERCGGGGVAQGAQIPSASPAALRAQVLGDLRLVQRPQLAGRQAREAVQHAALLARRRAAASRAAAAAAAAAARAAQAHPAHLPQQRRLPGRVPAPGVGAARARARLLRARGGRQVRQQRAARQAAQLAHHVQAHQLVAQQLRRAQVQLRRQQRAQRRRAAARVAGRGQRQAGEAPAAAGSGRRR